MKVKEKSEKAGLKLNTEKTKIMASGPITSWQIVGGKVETVTDCVFLGSRITMDGDCRYKIKIFASWKESYDRPRQRIKRDITLPTKVRLVKAIVFPVVMYGCESWSIKKASSVQFSRSVVSDSLRPQESQHARPPCPSQTPGVHSDSRPSSQ